MKILLDYFFPIASIEPTPQASTAFLKQVLVVVKPKGGVTPGVITTATSMSGVSAVTDNTEAQQLFNAGMNRVFVLPMTDLDLIDAIAGKESEFFTILISSDFSDAEITHVDSVLSVKASKKIQDVTFTAKTAGAAGNTISVNYDTGAGAGLATVGVVGNAITVTISSTTTAQTIKNAVDASSPAAALVDVAVDVGDETDIQEVFGAAEALTGGVDQVVGSDEGLQVGIFSGVIGVSSTDDAFLADQATMTNRVAFHTSSANKAKNMFFAFGKLLSNTLGWKNQQYIPMPVADDVATLGEANNLFNDKISFVISDDEYGNRLALFTAGGKAVVSPYIKKNLQIDSQSAALSYISGNQPDYTLKQAALLEDEIQKVFQSYIDRQLIEAGTAEVRLEQDNFIASGYFNISEPKALWRVEGEMRQTL